MIELLGCSLIILLSYLEAYFLHELIQELKDRSQQKSDARRAASMPKIRKQVHDEWEQYRNRQTLWNYLNGDDEYATFRKSCSNRNKTI